MAQGVKVIVARSDDPNLTPGIHIVEVILRKPPSDFHTWSTYAHAYTHPNK